MSDEMAEDAQGTPPGDPPGASDRAGSGREPGGDEPAAGSKRPARLLRLLVVVVVTIVAVTAIAVASGGGDSSPPKPGSRAANSTARAITALLAGIPQNANTLGQPAAPVVLYWYGDLECPFCKEFTVSALPEIITRWVRGGELKIVYLSMESATHEPKTFQTQQVAALAAGLQNKMWNYVETFYHEQGTEDSGYVTDGYLRGLATQIPGLNLALWTEDRSDPLLVTKVLAERQAALHARYPGTPTFLIGRVGRRPYRFVPPSLTQHATFDKAVEYVLGT